MRGPATEGADHLPGLYSVTDDDGGLHRFDGAAQPVVVGHGQHGPVHDHPGIGDSASAGREDLGPHAGAQVDAPVTGRPGGRRTVEGPDHRQRAPERGLPAARHGGLDLDRTGGMPRHHEPGHPEGERQHDRQRRSRPRPRSTAPARRRSPRGRGCARSSGVSARSVAGNPRPRRSSGRGRPGVGGGGRPVLHAVMLPSAAGAVGDGCWHSVDSDIPEPLWSSRSRMIARTPLDPRTRAE